MGGDAQTVRSFFADRNVCVLGILLVGYIYVWKRGALAWE